MVAIFYQYLFQLFTINISGDYSLSIFISIIYYQFQLNICCCVQMPQVPRSGILGGAPGGGAPGGPARRSLLPAAAAPHQVENTRPSALQHAPA